MTEIEMFRGAMIGGACGDALGYPLQELSVCRSRKRKKLKYYGSKRIYRYILVTLYIDKVNICW